MKYIQNDFRDMFQTFLLNWVRLLTYVQNLNCRLSIIWEVYAYVATDRIKMKFEFTQVISYSKRKFEDTQFHNS